MAQITAGKTAEEAIAIVDASPPTQPWMVDAMTYLEAVSGVSWWKELLVHWRRFEDKMEHATEQPSKKYLSSKDRPEEVKFWISRGRHYPKPPTIKNPAHFAVTFKRWWTHLQPGCRRSTDSEWPLPRAVTDDTNWVSLQLGGANGIFVVIMCLAWW
ncbi:uncharacterized protein BXZ73DRAFT_53969, partial [Epithele typhae]|uniref:uncharacterized protein n=1 Tax=Epithele typhae TaxID=378194 RepID=UPI0020077A18